MRWIAPTLRKIALQKSVYSTERKAKKIQVRINLFFWVKLLAAMPPVALRAATAKMMSPRPPMDLKLLNDGRNTDLT